MSRKWIDHVATKLNNKGGEYEKLSKALKIKILFNDMFLPLIKAMDLDILLNYQINL